MVVDYSQTINRFTHLDAYPLPRIDDLVMKMSKYSIFSTLDLRSAYHQVSIRAENKKFTAFEACGNLYQFRRIPFGVTNGVACFQRAIDSMIREEKLEGTFAYVDNISVCGHNQDEHNRNLAKFMEVAAKYNLTLNESKSLIAQNTIRLLGYEVSHGSIKPDPERFEALRSLPPPNDTKSQQRIVGMFAYYSQWISRFSDKIHAIVQNKTFPLPDNVLRAFHTLKQELESAMLVTVQPEGMLVIETDASDVAIAATLNQNNRPVAFFSRTLSSHEKHQSSVEKEACAIVEAIRKWRHYLLPVPFQVVTDQRSVAFMYDTKHKSNIKNEKIARWRIELTPFRFEVVYRPGKENAAADALSRISASVMSNRPNLVELHEALCHPGITRMTHFVRARNLPYSISDVRDVIQKCKVCAEEKPRFFQPQTHPLIKATQPFERLSVDFKGPLPSASRNRYLLTIIDEFSRFPFAFPTSDLSAKTVINCLTQLFAIFGMPSFIHSDRGTAFMSSELTDYLHSKGIATSRTTPYNPQSNGQIERLNSTLWKSISLALKTRRLQIVHWESVLLDALHSIRSLLNTITNCTPHERFFIHSRRSSSGITLPSWLLSPG
ncbi:MAG: reverse transcriptase domain-containing protein, partial [Candidatus Thiodiazotropha sp.]